MLAQTIMRLVPLVRLTMLMNALENKLQMEVSYEYLSLASQQNLPLPQYD